MSYTYPFKKVSATATMVVMDVYDADPDNWMILLGYRKPDSSAFPGMISLPGGYLNPDEETVEECAIRELEEETGIKQSKDDLMLFHVSSKPDTDPRGHVVNTCFLTFSSKDTKLAPTDDLKNPIWVKIKDLPEEMAFDHRNIALLGIEKAYDVLAY